MVSKGVRRRVVSGRKPGQPGTPRLVKLYGQSLRRVRYVCEHETGERYKSIELVQSIRPAIVPEIESPPVVWVGIEVDVREFDLRRRVRAAGGYYGHNERLWFVKKSEFDRLDLQSSKHEVKETVAIYRV
jgi:hypothetical protein